MNTRLTKFTSTDVTTRIPFLFNGGIWMLQMMPDVGDTFYFSVFDADPFALEPTVFEFLPASAEDVELFLDTSEKKRSLVLGEAHRLGSTGALLQWSTVDPSRRNGKDCLKVELETPFNGTVGFVVPRALFTVWKQPQKE